MKTTTLLVTALGFLVSSCASPTGPSSSATSQASASVKPYPRDTCIVTGNKLGSMGTPITQVYQGQEVKFCCKPCTKKFAANPGKYLADL